MFSGLNLLNKAIRIITGNFRAAVRNSAPQWWWPLDENTGVVADDEMDNGDLTYDLDASTANYSITSSSTAVPGASKDIDADINRSIYDSTPDTAREIIVNPTAFPTIGKVIQAFNPVHYWRFSWVDTRTSLAEDDLGSRDQRLLGNSIMSQRAVGRGVFLGNNPYAECYYNRRATTGAGNTSAYVCDGASANDSGNVSGSFTITSLMRWMHNPDKEFNQHIMGAWNTNTSTQEWRLYLQWRPGTNEHRLVWAHYETGGTLRQRTLTEDNEQLFSDGGVYDQNNQFYLWWLEVDDPTDPNARIRFWINNELIADKELPGAGNGIRSGTEAFRTGSTDTSDSGHNFDISEIAIFLTHIPKYLKDFVWRAHSTGNSIEYSRDSSTRYPTRYVRYPTDFLSENLHSRPFYMMDVRNVSGGMDDYAAYRLPSSPNCWRFNGSGAPNFEASPNNVPGDAVRTWGGLEYTFDNLSKPQFFGTVIIYEACWDFALNNLDSIGTGLTGFISKWDIYEERANYRLRFRNDTNLIQLQYGVNGTVRTYEFTGLSDIFANSDWHYFSLTYRQAAHRRIELWIDGQLRGSFAIAENFSSLTNAGNIPVDGQLVIAAMAQVRMDHCALFRGQQAHNPYNAYRRYSWWKNNERSFGGPGDSSLFYTMDTVDISGTNITDQSQFQTQVDGTFLSAPSTVASDGWGQSVVFNGSQAITFPSNAEMDNANFIINGWFKVSNTGQIQGLAQRCTVDPNLHGWRLFVDADGYVVFECGDGAGNIYRIDSNTDFEAGTVPRTVNDGALHYIAAARREGVADQVGISIDGFTFTKSAETLVMSYPASPVCRIGCLNNTGTNVNFLNGNIDTFRFCYRYDDIATGFDMNFAYGGGLPPAAEYPQDPVVRYNAGFTSDSSTMSNLGSQAGNDLESLTNPITKTAYNANTDWGFGFEHDDVQTYRSISNPFSSNYEGDFTVAFKFRTSNPTGSGSGGYGNLVSCSNYSNRGFIFDLNANTGQLRCFMGSGAALTGIGIPSGNPDLRDGEWHTIVVTHEDVGTDGQAFVWIDGVRRVTPTTIPGRCIASNDTLDVLQRSGNDTELLGAEMGEVEIYTRLLSDAEIEVLSDPTTSVGGGNKTIGNLTQDFTITIAFKVDVQTEAAVIISKGEFGSNDWTIYEGGSGNPNLIRFTLVQSDGTVRDEVLCDIDIAPANPTGQWNFLQVRMDYSGTQRLEAWLNCQQTLDLDVSTWSGSWQQAVNAGLCIGNDIDGGDNALNGAVDEPIIHTKAITDGEINSICALWAGGGQTIYQVTVEPTSVQALIPNGPYTTPELVATVIGGVGPFTYAWTSNGANLVADSPTADRTTFSGNENGVATTETLTCTVTDTGNANLQTSFDITTNVEWRTQIALGLDISDIDDTTSAPTYITSTVTATVTGGTGPFDFEWNRIGGTTTIFNPTNPSQSGAATTFPSQFTGAGNNQTASEVWECTVTDSLGQQATAQLTIDVEFGVIPTLLVSLSQSIINGYTESGSFNTVPISTLAVGGQPPYSYSWARVSGDTVFNPNNPTARIPFFVGTAPDGSTTTEVWRVTVTDSAAVPNQATADLTISCQFGEALNELTVNIPENIIFYNGPNGPLGTQFVEAEISGGTPPYNIVWSLTGINRRSGTTDLADFEPGAFNQARTNFRGWLANADVVYTFACEVTDSTPGTPRFSADFIQVDVITF